MIYYYDSSADTIFSIFNSLSDDLLAVCSKAKYQLVSSYNWLLTSDDILITLIDDKWATLSEVLLGHQLTDEWLAFYFDGDATNLTDDNLTVVPHVVSVLQRTTSLPLGVACHARNIFVVDYELNGEWVQFINSDTNYLADVVYTAFTRAGVVEPDFFHQLSVQPSHPYSLLENLPGEDSLRLEDLIQVLADELSTLPSLERLL
jgi:hypothetical protein